MKKEFVPYDIALAMKELGFDEECLAVYVGRLDEIHLQTPPINRGYSKKALAPLYQQAFRWFREKGFYISIYPIQAFESDDFCWGISHTLKKIKYHQKYYQNNEFRLGYREETYEEAQDACLRKLIEIVKEKK